jgi:hypothetical protein
MNATFAVLAGLYDFALAAFHMAFWRLFGWPGRLERLDEINRAVVPVLNLALIVLFVLLGLTMIAGAPPILTAGLAAFWLFRAALQPLYFGLAHPLSKLIFAVFLLGTVLHGLAVVL